MNLFEVLPDSTCSTLESAEAKALGNETAINAAQEETRITRSLLEESHTHAKDIENKDNAA